MYIHKLKNIKKKGRKPKIKTVVKRYFSHISGIMPSTFLTALSASVIIFAVSTAQASPLTSPEPTAFTPTSSTVILQQTPPTSNIPAPTNLISESPTIDSNAPTITINSPGNAATYDKVTVSEFINNNPTISTASAEAAASVLPNKPDHTASLDQLSNLASKVEQLTTLLESKKTQQPESPTPIPSPSSDTNSTNAYHAIFDTYFNNITSLTYWKTSTYVIVSKIFASLMSTFTNIINNFSDIFMGTISFTEWIKNGT